MKASDQAAATNEAILARVEIMGGGYVWDAENFSVTLMGIAATDSDAAILQDLRGVQQIALDASNVSFATIVAIARVPALESLVLTRASLSNQQIQELHGIVPEILLVTDEA